MRRFAALSIGRVAQASGGSTQEPATLAHVPGRAAHGTFHATHEADGVAEAINPCTESIDLCNELSVRLAQAFDSLAHVPVGVAGVFVGRSGYPGRFAPNASS